LEFFKNVSIKLKAGGVAAVLIVWMLCMTILALYGESNSTYIVIGILSAFGFVVVKSIGAGDDSDG